MTLVIPRAIRSSPSSMTAWVVAATSHTLLTRRPAVAWCGTRTHTLPDAVATSIAHTRSIISSWSASGISSGCLLTMPVLHPGRRIGGGMPGGLGQGTENLTGVLDATVHDPARSGPGVRLAHGITPPREDVDVGRQPDPNFHACKASPEGTKRLARVSWIS